MDVWSHGTRMAAPADEVVGQALVTSSTRLSPGGGHAGVGGSSVTPMEILRILGKAYLLAGVATAVVAGGLALFGTAADRVLPLALLIVGGVLVLTSDKFVTRLATAPARSFGLTTDAMESDRTNPHGDVEISGLGLALLVGVPLLAAGGMLL